MEHTIKFPKNIDYKKVNIYAIPEVGLWAVMSGKDYKYLCRARDNGEGGNPSYWRVGLFVGGNVELGSIQYRIYPVNDTGDKDVYDDDYAVRYDEAQFIGIPCIHFNDGGELFEGEVVGFYKDGSCAVVPVGDLGIERIEKIEKIEPSKVRYLSDILEMG